LAVLQPRERTNSQISAKAAELKASLSRKADEASQLDNQAKEAARLRKEAGQPALQSKELPPGKLEAGSALLPIRMEIERQVVGRWGERLKSWLYPVR
jgi:hypothetical protein